MRFEVTMPAAVFRGWLTHMGWSNSKAAEQLGVDRKTIASYRKNGAPEKVKLACRALAHAEQEKMLGTIYPWEKPR